MDEEVAETYPMTTNNVIPSEVAAATGWRNTVEEPAVPLGMRKAGSSTPFIIRVADDEAPVGMT